jgi:predicted small lipoprotein YifL|tara:strand:- start:926 stop:2398 length:1473 start_codon:yes stop_codon:yes gene_type:complete
VQYTGNGSNLGPFSFSFKVLAAGDIKVSEGTTTKTVTTHYTTSLNADGTGTVTFTSGNAPANNAIVTIESDQAIERTTDYSTGGDFTAASINDALDRLTINDQQIETLLSRNIQLPATVNRTTSGTGTSGPLFFPYADTASDQASKLIAYDSNGTALETTTGRVNTVAVSNVGVDGSGNSQDATVSFNSSTGALSLGVPVGQTGAQGPTGANGVFAEIADQSEAEAGTNNTKGMTPLRVKQAVDSYGLLSANDLSDVASASTARTNLGLGDAATKTVGTSNGNVIAADATGLPAINGSQVTALNGSNISSGTVAVARLGSGSPGASNFLSGDGTWKAAGGGKVVAFSNTHVATDASTTATFPDDDTAPTSSEGAEYTTFTHTASSATNKILIQVIAQAATNGVVVPVLALFKDSGSTAERTVFEETHGNGPVMMTLQHLDTAGSTSEITYKLRFGSSGNTGTVYLGSQHHGGARWNDTGGVNIQIWELEA